MVIPKNPPKKNTIHVGADFDETVISPQLMHLFLRSSEPWGVKDLESRYVFANQLYFKFLEIDKNLAHSIYGHSYSDIPALAPLEEGLTAHDQQVIQQESRLEAIGTMKINNIHRSFVFEKFPFYDNDGKVIGTIFHLKPFKQISFGYFLEVPFYGEARFTVPSGIFSKREWEVLFLLFRGLKKPQIAATLGIKENSVRSIVSKLFLKGNVSSNEELLNRGLGEGWHLYVPPRFVSVGYEILLKNNTIK